MTGSGGQRRIPESYLAQLEVPLPPVEEQQRIAEVLDQADELRVKRRRAIAILDDLAESIFLDMFGAEAQFQSCRLGEVAEIVSGITKGRKVPDGVELRTIPRRP
ncbi:restriction endonuclease subunit S [Actinoallomurus sp. NPDC050550]|uniref:restriction endonuclease subunit S n=1 Tax=Actinoallomurus sp. NPDC050550 TaxID=3154937 RepID=UPI0034025536